MRMEVNVSVTTSIRELIIYHNNQKIEWNVAGYEKRVFMDPANDVCFHINEYWKQLPDAKQQQIFECYISIRKIFEEIYDTTLITRVLIEPIKHLLALHELEDIQQWIVWKSDIIIPDKFEENYVHDDMRPGTRVQTYTRSDYIGLLTMSLALRSMIPVWGEFIHRFKGDIGTNFKEMHAAHLINQTDIMFSPYMDKLQQYVESNVKTDSSNLGAVISGISSDDYSKWILSLVIVKRLCLGNLTGINPDINLVSFIFNYIRQKIGGKGADTFGNNNIRDKFMYFDESSTNDDGLSRVESYKIKQPVSTGDLVTIDYFLSDPYNVARLLDPNISKELLDKCLASCSVLLSEQIWEAQVLLAQWVLYKVVPPRSFNSLSKEKVVNAIAVTQAWLWYRGHKELSCLISAIASDNTTNVMLGGIDSRSRISKEQQELLGILYPFTMIRSLKQKTKPANDAILAIDSMVNKLGQRDWILTAPKEHTVEVTNNSLSVRYSIPYDIKVKLADLIIDLKSETVMKLGINRQGQENKGVI